MRKETGTIEQLAKKYDPVPIITISKKMIQFYFGFSSCIILSNPRIDNFCKEEICYDAEPSFYGRDVADAMEYTRQFQSGIIIHPIPSKVICLLTPRTNFEAVVKRLKKSFVFISIPDSTKKIFESKS